MKFRENDTAYIVENGIRVTQVRITKVSGGLYTVTPGEGKAMRLREGRLYETAEEAERHTYRPVIKENPAECPQDPHEWEYRESGRKH